MLVQLSSVVVFESYRQFLRNFCTVNLLHAWPPRSCKFIFLPSSANFGADAARGATGYGSCFYDGDAVVEVDTNAVEIEFYRCWGIKSS